MEDKETWKGMKASIEADFKRNYAYSWLKFLLADFFFPNYRFRFLFWLRVAEMTQCNRHFRWLYPLAAICYHHYSQKGNIEISFYSVGKGVKIQHTAGFIIVHSEARIGDNVHLSPGVIVGISSLNRRHELPVIGNDCYLAPNAKVFGKCHIGHRVVIATDTVVRDMDVPDDAIVVGTPAKIILKAY